MPVDLTLAQELKAAGYPQDQWPQLVYLLGEEGAGHRYRLTYRDAGNAKAKFWEWVDDNGALHLFDWCAAPDALSALMWLVTKLPPNTYLGLVRGKWYIATVRNENILGEEEWETLAEADTPEALLRLCLAAIKC